MSYPGLYSPPRMAYPSTPAQASVVQPYERPPSPPREYATAAKAFSDPFPVFTSGPAPQEPRHLHTRKLEQLHRAHASYVAEQAAKGISVNPDLYEYTREQEDLALWEQQNRGLVHLAPPLPPPPPPLPVAAPPTTQPPPVPAVAPVTPAPQPQPIPPPPPPQRAPIAPAPPVAPFVPPPTPGFHDSYPNGSPRPGAAAGPVASPLPPPPPPPSRRPYWERPHHREQVPLPPRDYVQRGYWGPWAPSPSYINAYNPQPPVSYPPYGGYSPISYGYSAMPYPVYPGYV